MAESSDYLKDILHEAVDVMQGGCEYADALYDRVEGLIISKDTVDEKVSTPPLLSGIGLRVFKGGEWREASIHQLDRDKVLDVAKKLLSFKPRASDGVKLKELKGWKLDETVGMKVDPRTVSLEQKLGKVRELFKMAKEADGRIINVIVRYSENVLERIFANTEGSMLRQVVPRVRSWAVPVAKEGDKVDYDTFSLGGVGGYENFDSIGEAQIRKVVGDSLKLLKAVKAPSGEFPIILDAGMVGTFAHESFGHGCEADQVVRKRSYLIDHLGKRIGPEGFNLYDDSTLRGGQGSFLFDDEGVEAKKTAIVEDGVLTRFLQDRLSSSMLNVEPTGNARRECFMRRVFVRMTNTYVGPGDWTLEEMLEDVDYGVLFEHWHSGMEDPLAGGMQLKSKKGRLIEKGKLTKPLSTLSLTGDVLKFTGKIDAVGGKEYFKTDAGMCGKGSEDYVPVGSGGTYVRSVAVVSQG